MRCATSPRQAGFCEALRLASPSRAVLETVAPASWEAKAVAASVAEKSSGGEFSVVNEESQKLQARTLYGSTAPHCEQVFVTGVLRCGRFHSGEEGTPQEYHERGKVKQELKRLCYESSRRLQAEQKRKRTKRQSVATACRG